MTQNGVIYKWFLSRQPIKYVFLQPFCITNVKTRCFLIELFGSIVCITYLCIVFFMVLDLRLTKIGTQRSPFFYALTFSSLLCNFKSVSPILREMKKSQWLHQLHEYWERKWTFPFLSLALFPFHLFQKSLSSSVLLRRKHRKLEGYVIVFNWKQKRVCFIRHTCFFYPK